MKHIYSLLLPLLFLFTYSFCSAQWERMMMPDTGYGLSDVAMPDSLTCIGVGEFGTILISHDYFKSWKRCDLQSRTDFFCLGFFDKNIGITAGADGTMMRTTDGGNTWQKQPSGTYDTLQRIAVLSPTEAVAVGSKGTIIRTTDAGKTWTVVVSNTMLTLRSVAFNAAGIGIAVGDNGTILRSTDKGMTWILKKSPMKWDLYAVSLVDDLVCAGGDSVSIVRSTDAGNTWKLQTVLYPTTATARKIGASFDDILDIQFIDEQTGFLCGNFDIVNRVHYMRIFRTDDGGQSWQKYTLANVTEDEDKTLNPTSGSWRKLVFKNTIGIAVGGFGGSGSILTHDLGEKWEPTLYTPDTTAQYIDPRYYNYYHSLIINKSEILICETLNALTRSTDNGQTWTKQQPVGSFENLSMDLYEDFGIIGADSGRIYVSEDAGQTWSLTSSNGVSTMNSGAVYDVVVISPTTAFCNKSGVRNYRTTDRAKTWVEIHPNGNMGDTLPYGSTRYSAPSFTDPMNGWILAQKRDSLGYYAGYAVYLTDNGGNTWVDKTPTYLQESTDKVANMKIHFFDKNHGWYFVGRATGNSNSDDDLAIVRTNDGGNTWTLKEFKNMPGLKALFTGKSFIVESVAFSTQRDGILLLYDFYSSGSSIFNTSDGGETWQRMTVKGAYVRPISCFDVKYQDSTTAWVVGANTVLRWKKEASSDVQEGKEVAGTITLSPNPTNNTFTISGTESISAVKVVNNLGEIVVCYTTLHANQDIDVSDLVSGMYYVKIYTDTGIISRPIVVQH